jgi:transposase
MRRIEVDLSPDERHELEHIVKQERDARMVKRAQALLWLNEGEKVTAVVRRLQVKRQTVYNWLKMYNARRGEPMRQRLQDRDRPRRPASKRKAVQIKYKLSNARNSISFGCKNKKIDDG